MPRAHRSRRRAAARRAMSRLRPPRRTTRTATALLRAESLTDRPKAELCEPRRLEQARARACVRVSALHASESASDCASADGGSITACAAERRGCGQYGRHMRWRYANKVIRPDTHKAADSPARRRLPTPPPRTVAYRRRTGREREGQVRRRGPITTPVAHANKKPTRSRAVRARIGESAATAVAVGSGRKRCILGEEKGVIAPDKVGNSQVDVNRLSNSNSSDGKWQCTARQCSRARP